MNHFALIPVKYGVTKKNLFILKFIYFNDIFIKYKIF